MVTSTILKPSDIASGGFFTGNTRLQLNVVTESASGSVAGRVRGHDEKGSVYSEITQR